MQILQVNKFHWLKGGSETAYFGVTSLLETHGHRVITFSMKDPRNLPSPYERFFVENVSYGCGGAGEKVSAAMKIVFSREARKRIEALLREVAPEVAHFHVFQHQISPSVFGPLRKRGIPLVLTLHDLKPICPNYMMLTHDGVCERCRGRKFYNCLLHRCSKGSALNSLVNTVEMYLHYSLGYYQSVDRYIAVSEFYRRKMIDFGFPAEQVVHIPNFIDASRFSPPARDEGYGMYFGRLSPEKGVMTLLDALKRVPQLPFMVVGSGPMEKELRSRVAELGLQNVKFTGFKAGKELLGLLSGAAFTVLPSEWYENCPMSVLESFAMGKPVIGARIGGVPELIEEEVDGVTFESGNPEDLAVKLERLRSDRKMLMAMGRKGREKVEREFSPEGHYERLMGVYQGVMRT